MSMKTIRIDGIVGDLLNTADGFKARVAELGLSDKDDLKVVVNSQGGSVLEGYGIYNFLRNLDNEVFIDIDGFAGSIATLISLATKKENTSISEVSMFMIHRSSTTAEGNQEQLASQIKILDSIDNTLASVYSERTDIPKDTITEMMSKETWLSGADAVEAGFIGSLSNKISADVVARVYSKQIKENMNLVEKMMSSFKAEAEEEKKKEEETVTAEAKAEKDKEDEEAKAESTDTMEAFTQLVEAVSKLSAKLDEDDKVAETDEEIEKKKELEEEEMSAIISAEVEAKVKSTILNLKASKGMAPVGITKEPTAVNAFTAHRARQKEIENKTRL